MSKAAERIIAAKDGKPSIDDLKNAIKKFGLSFNTANHPRIKTAVMISNAEDASNSLRNAFIQLVTYVGLQRSGDLNVDDVIRDKIAELAEVLVVDDKSLDDVTIRALKDVDNHESHTAREAIANIIGRIEAAYNEVCGPVKGAGKVV
ncbi:MAG: hypothetical protein SFW63_00220 [Alphaproteobacteria bacterium]|nr:hypothetical protein [Alphaproteobacteria bacterium]